MYHDFYVGYSNLCVTYSIGHTEMCGLGGGEVKASQTNKRKYFLVEYPHHDCALLEGI